MKRRFLNPVFRFLDESIDMEALLRMGFEAATATPSFAGADSDSLGEFAQDPVEFFKKWELKKGLMSGFTLVGVDDWGKGAFALYVRPLTPFAEELLALGLRHMRTAEYATLAKRPSRQRDWVGQYVQLKRRVENKYGTVFPAGLIMEVTGSYGGLTLETVEMYKPSGVFVQHRIGKVPVEWVDLVVVPFEGGHE